MSAYASGKFALAVCDRCGFTCDYKELKEIIVRKRKTGERVCPECWEADHPQNMQGMFRVVDPQALRHATGDPDKQSAAGIFGWNPVFVQAMDLRLGSVLAV